MPKKAAETIRHRRRLGAYSRQGAIALLDGRSREVLFLKHFRTELTAHCGGRPSAVQIKLIERAARLALHLEILDERLGTGTFGDDKDSKTYLAWSNFLTRTLRQIGLKGAPPRQQTIEEVMKACSARPAA